MSVWRSTSRPGGGGGERSLPAVPLDQVLARMKSSYSEIDLSSAESSLQSVAVYAATDLIASLVSELPLDVFRGSGGDRKQISTPWWLEDPDGSGQGLPDWCYRAVMSWLLRGNLFGEELQRSTSGFLQQVELFHPDRVSGAMDEGEIRWMVNGTTIPTARFLHRRVNPVPGVVLGLSPIRLLASTIGLSLTATRFGLQWFQDGAHPNALLINEEVALDDGQVKQAKARFLAALRGTREPVVLGKGWQYKPLQLAPEESQFLETQKYSQAECARIFGPGIAEILGYGSGSMTYSNIVDRDISLLKYAVGKWIRRTERVLSEFLPRPQYARFNRDALLETNTMQRYLAHASALTNNWQTINQVRDTEDMPPVAWGDAPFVAGAGVQPPADEDPEQEE
ncbi:phage portal protein [Streptomyces bacillaris]|uniref:phage portal protein n=1 Tax=Streptomyces bacillaris TaxID=68179 RepID=UPI0034606AE6